MTGPRFTRDRNRLQMNVSQTYMRYGYNLVVKTMTRSEAAIARNEIVELAEEYLWALFREFAAEHSSIEIATLVQRYIAEDERSVAMRFWQQVVDDHP